MVALAAGIISSLRNPVYQATARVLLRPNDPNEQLNPDNNAAQNFIADPNRYVSGQVKIVESEGVARQATEVLKGVSVEDLERSISVSQDGQSNVLKIAATDGKAARARDMANALAHGYIENRRQAAVAGLQRAAKDLEDRLGPLQTQIAQYDVRIGAESGGSAEALKAARSAAALQYETLYARQQELLVNISLKRGEAELIQEAKVPESPMSPHPGRDAILGGFVGLLLGVGVSFVREQLNDRLRSVEEVERVSGLPLLGRLPLDEEAAKGSGGVVVVERPNTPLAEAVRSLRTSIQYLGVDAPIKLIVVTSSVPGEGKSLVAANLATMFAEADYRTLLVSADLRRSSIDQLFGKTPSAPGLSGLLAPFGRSRTPHASGNGNSSHQFSPAEQKEIVRAVVNTPVSNLLLLPAGQRPPNPAELLASRRMSMLLTEWSASADVVILDTPPLLAVTDAAVLAARADGVVLVTAINETKREDLTHSIAVLEGTSAQLLGVVVNKVPMSGHRGYHHYGYYGSDVSEAKNGQRRGVRGAAAKAR